MNEFDLLSLIGEVDERYLEESERYSERPRIIKKWAVSAASLLLLTSLVLIPVKNGALGCASADPAQNLYTVSFDAEQEFLYEVGRNSLFWNLSFDEDFADRKMFCEYRGGALARNVYRYTPVGEESVIMITEHIGASHHYIASDRIETMEICGVQVTLYYFFEDTNEKYSVSAVFKADGNLYFVSISEITENSLLIKTVEDLLMAE